MKITITRDDKRQIEVTAVYDPRRAVPTGEMVVWGGYVYFLKPNGSVKWRELTEPEGTWHKGSWHESLPQW